ncbi:unnamed protein product [Rotaria sp. Silwood2]|nr:unnamed protein product [Rotaria sp. Silwood2]CAF2913403.1 unnamed protein product [Rotaria sp. Silwood2]CAF3036364.1 unnamed protein product [Rotaria sp. Silwood2]CAF4083869.1 unnamed protein product [Rotaria sp. Silwood2]CAF4361409.1 unnamed protein product [Rotaria sp. Silwood2]
MTLGLTSTLSDLVQKAVEIELNIVQHKIDDKLRDAHKEGNINKQKSTVVNNLFSISKPNSSALRNYDAQESYDNYNDNIKYSKNQHDHFGNKYLHIFKNSKITFKLKSRLLAKLH